MTITNKTKLHLNTTYYFDDDGYSCDTLEEARELSYDPSCVTVVRQQNCYMLEFSELSADLQEEACFLVARSEFDVKPQELMYVVGATTKQILIINYWTELQKDLDKGIYTIVKEKRN